MGVDSVGIIAILSVSYIATRIVKTYTSLPKISRVLVEKQIATLSAVKIAIKFSPCRNAIFFKSDCFAFISIIHSRARIVRSRGILWRVIQVSFYLAFVYLCIYGSKIDQCAFHEISYIREVQLRRQRQAFFQGLFYFL